MKRALNIAFAVGLFINIVSLIQAKPTRRPQSLSSAAMNIDQIITADRDFWLCAKNPGQTCTWRGSPLAAAMPNDANPCTFTQPCVTLSAVASRVNGHVAVGANVSVHMADDAGTGVDCYPANAVLFHGLSEGGPTSWAYITDSTANGGQQQSDTYPTAMLKLLGSTNPTNNHITGTTCAGTTVGNRNLITVTGFVVYINGVSMNYAAGNALIVNNAPVAMVESSRFISDPAAPNDYAMTFMHSHARFGGSITVTNYSVGIDIDGAGSDMDDKTPLGNLAWIYSCSCAGVGILIQEEAKKYTDSGTYTWNGSGCYIAERAQDGGKIVFNDGAPVTYTYNASSCIIPFQADQNSYISANACETSGINNFVCNPTVAPAVYIISRTGSNVYVGTKTGGSGKGSACTDSKAEKGGRIFIDWFGNGPVCGDSTPLSNQNGSYSSIASTNTETYWSIGTDGKIYSGRFNAIARHLKFEAFGFYATNSNTDSITLNAKLCTVSGCGSGTVVSLGATGAVVPGVTIGVGSPQAWELMLDCQMYTSGASATMDCRGKALFFTGTQAVVAAPINNSTTVTFNGTVDQFLSLSAKWNNASANNAIQLREFLARVPY